MCNDNTIYKILSKFVTAAMMMTFILGCSGSRNLGATDRTYNGPPMELGEGHAYAFTKIDASGKPLGDWLEDVGNCFEGPARRNAS